MQRVFLYSHLGAACTVFACAPTRKLPVFAACKGIRAAWWRHAGLRSLSEGGCGEGKSVAHVRFSGVLTAALLWQSALVVNIGTPAAPEHLRFERALRIPGAAGGLFCVTLDGQVLAHTASAAHDDLRLYRTNPGSLAQAETPFLLTESGPEPVADAEVAPVNVRHHGDGLQFDLHMPPRAYADVVLRLGARNFVGTVVVSGETVAGERKNPGNFGSFGIYDLSAQGLGRWTVLPMAETTAHVLHLTLDLRTPEGRPVRRLPLALLQGAAVPPSRERQTLYTPVASTGEVRRLGNMSAADMQVPEHVPVERIRFVLPPEFGQNYLREVIVRDRAEDDPGAETEVMNAGAIQHVRWPADDPRLNPIDVTANSVDATIGATLASRATVRVLVANGTEPPLPIRGVVLEMRERRVCFRAAAGAPYVLRYGDAALAAPVYDQAALLDANSPSGSAELGPERPNPQWQRRTDARPYLDRHPEVFWLLVLLCTGMMGGTALHFVQHRELRGNG